MKIFFKRFQLVIWLLAGVGLMYYTFKDLNLTEIWNSLKKVELKWLLIVLAVSLLNHIIRAVRWQLMLKALGFPVGIVSSFTNLMFGYFVNNAIPRGGEFSRCLSLKKTDNVPFNVSFGTVLVERLVDTTCLALLVGFTLFTQYDELGGFWMDKIWMPIRNSFSKGGVMKEYKLYILAGFGVIFILFKIFEKKIEATGINSKIDDFSNEMWEGLKTLVKMKDLPLFLVYTVLIWVGYYFMSQLWFYALPEFAHLGWKAALMIMVVGTIGRSVPVPGGGMGAYHSLVAQALLIYGLTLEQGSVMAVLIHETQLLYVLVIGGLCYIPILIARKKEEQLASL
jgi:uncharacterized protein (TIRG00374 family)